MILLTQVSDAAYRNKISFGQCLWERQSVFLFGC